MRGLPSSIGARLSRRRISIAVTMRPRRLSMPAISGAASGTRASRSGTNTSCTREIGRPNSCPPMVAVTYSIPVSVSLMIPSRRDLEVGGLLLERRDHPLPVEFGHTVVQTDLTAALDCVDRDRRRETDDRKAAGARVAAQRRRQCEAVHAGHF